MAWTNAQLDAINIKDKTILVSASAGSGKTASLTERIIRSLKQGSDASNENAKGKDISRLLIVTFTIAAASELRSKIAFELSKALASDPDNSELRNQLIKLPSAKISTMDSFFMDVVKQNFSKLGIPSSFRIGDQTELKVLYSDIMEDVIEDLYNKPSGEGEYMDFSALADNFTDFKKEYSLSETFLTIRQIFEPYAEGIELLRMFSEEYRKADGNIFETEAGKALLKKYHIMFSDLCDICEYAADELSDKEIICDKYPPLFKKDGDFYGKMRDAIASADAERIAEVASSAKFENFTSLGKKADPEIAVRFRLLRNDMKNRALSAAKKLVINRESNSFFMEKTADICMALYDVLREFESRLMNEKIVRRMFDFSDITRFMLKLVADEKGKPTETALALRERFDEIYIDEYQDTNAIQDAIFRAISKNNNRFMVGDIKQSIYAFRGGDPNIFAQYRKQFPPLDADDICASINMSENFRCDENIIDFVNIIFSFAFDLCRDSIGYSPKDDLIFGKGKPYENYVPPKAVLAILNSSVETEPANDSLPSDTVSSTDIFSYEEAEVKGEKREFDYIASEIEKLIKYGKKASGESIFPGDCTILVRYTREIPMASAALEKRSIRAVCQVEEELFKTPEVLLMTAVLSVIDNPTDDAQLTATLRSPLFGFNFNELIMIRKLGDPCDSLYENIVSYISCEKAEPSAVQKCKAFTEWLEKYRLIAESLPVDKLLRILYRDPRCAFSTCSQSLNTFYEYARSYESGSFKGVYNFVRYIDSIKKRGFKADSEFTTEKNAVTVMTIHKSKGLQFPVCFIAGLSNSFNYKDLQKSFIFDRKAGPAVNIVDINSIAKYITPLKNGVAVKKTEALNQEELRVLYVAMTRAQERLYLTANVPDIDALIDKYDFRCNYTDRDADISVRSYLPTVMRAISLYLNKRGSSLKDHISNYSDRQALDIPFEMVFPDRYTTAADVVGVSELTADSSADRICGSVDDRRLMDIFTERFSYRYPYAHVVNMPAKLSVSKLTPEVLDNIDNYDSPIGFGKRSDITLITDFGESVLKQPDAAEKGTATHLVLQFCDIEKLRTYGTDSELHRLVSEKFIPKSTVDIVRKDEISKFAESSLFGRIRNAKRIYREQRFNLTFNAYDFTKNPELCELLKKSGEELCVQGVIDIFFVDENDKLVLCDYKTDRIPRDTASDSDKLQKLMHSRHGEQLSYYNKAVKELMGRYPDEVIVYCTQLGREVKIF